MICEHPSKWSRCSDCNRRYLAAYRATHKRPAHPRAGRVVDLLSDLRVKRVIHLHWVIKGRESYWRAMGRASQLCADPTRCLIVPVR